MNIEIIYSKSALAFLSKNSDKLSIEDSDLLIVKAIKKIYKIEVASMSEIDFRGSIY